MNILFTGASSFTGMWFVKELVDAGHNVTAVFTRPLAAYSGVRLQRVQIVQPLCQCLFDVRFGDEAFLSLVNSQQWDLLCHHAADVTNYKSPQFDPVKALANNAHNLANTLEVLRNRGCSEIILTGSVFEQREGRGTKPLRAFSPYGLSKGLTYDLFAYYSGVYGISLSKFVIPNPFGPYEEERFTSYLIDTWMQGKIPQVKTPSYIRDNVPVTLLAKAYRKLVAKRTSTYHPSCYAETQGLFAKRVADAMRSRLQLPCELQLCEQTSFQEPLERVNSNNIDWEEVQWNESAFWDEFADYYLQKVAIR